MKLWNSIKRLFNPEPVVESNPYDEMVGEPVVSFLEALKRKPSRFRVKRLSYVEFVSLSIEGFERYPWMVNVCYWKLIDRETGREYPAIILDGKLYSVYTLPFSLNGWELRAIEAGLVNHRRPARDRNVQMAARRWAIATKAKVAEEALARETFAWQFREGGR